MKENPHVAGKSHRWKGLLRNSKPKFWHKLYYNAGLISLVVLSLLVICYPTNTTHRVGRDHVSHVFKQLMNPAILMPGDSVLKHWNHSSYRFQPKVSDWDEQRARWMRENATEQSDHEGHPRTLMVTSSSPEHCQPAIFSHLLLRAVKNKVDYCRMQDIELYYSMGNHNEDFSDWWVKLPLIRMLMLQHPEYEWIWWVDADAIFTNMSFAPPFGELDDYNLVVQGDEYRLFRLRDWRALSTANFMIRNSQWSLDLLDVWASMGTASRRDEAGTFVSEVLTDRPSEIPADDQSALVFSLLQDKSNSASNHSVISQVKLVQDSEFVLNADWKTIGPDLEKILSSENESLPFVTHFEGCLPSCNANSEFLTELLESSDCQEQLERAFDFADNQVYGQYGFLPRPLGNYTTPFTKEATGLESEEPPKTAQEYKMAPPITDWDEKREAWLREHPPQKSNHVILVSGSTPHPCIYQPAANLLVRGMKNRIDFCRKHGYEFFYNMVDIDKGLTGWWIKLPLLKLMMLNNPKAEWVWWMDSDAVLTDMDFQFPFERYNASGFNFALYGSEWDVYDKKSWTGINTGDILIRNCQESLDMLDRWASIAYTPELRHENIHILTEVLDRTDGWDVDDQSVFAYLLIAEREKWAPKVCLENQYTMSGEWHYWTSKFEDGMLIDSPEYKPLVTHFAGCHPCREDPDVECLVGMERSYSYAENQVLSTYGLTHEHLNLTDIQVLDLSRNSDESGHSESNAEGKETSEEGNASQEETPSNSAEEEVKKEQAVETDQDTRDKSSTPAEQGFDSTDGLNVTTGEVSLEQFKKDTKE